MVQGVGWGSRALGFGVNEIRARSQAPFQLAATKGRSGILRGLEGGIIITKL